MKPCQNCIWDRKWLKVGIYQIWKWRCVSTSCTWKTLTLAGQITHCLGLDLNDLFTRRNFWSIPGMLENYTIPKWKEFLKLREPILRKFWKIAKMALFYPCMKIKFFFGPNAFIWSAKKVPFSDFIQNMSLAPSMCLFTWIKVDK